MENNLIGISILSIVLFTNCSPKGESVKFVKISEQTWMAENLNVEKFRNGDPIPEAKSNEEWFDALYNEQPAWCYYNNDSTNGVKYGKIYNYYAVEDLRGLAPKGWRIPTEADWNLLISFLGGRNKAGNKLKNEIGWENLENEELHTGFNAKAGGERIGLNSFYRGKFIREGDQTTYWTSTKTSRGVAIGFAITKFQSGAYGGNYGVDCGFSVRCIKE